MFGNISPFGACVSSVLALLITVPIFVLVVEPAADARNTISQAKSKACTDQGGTELYIKHEGTVCFAKGTVLGVR